MKITHIDEQTKEVTFIADGITHKVTGLYSDDPQQLIASVEQYLAAYGRGKEVGQTVTAISQDVQDIIGKDLSVTAKEVAVSSK